MRYLLALLFVLLCPFSGHAQWQTVAGFGQKVVVPNGMLIRYGSAQDNKFTTPKIFSALSFTVNSAVFPTNPDPTAVQGTFVLQAYQLPIAQTLTVAGAAVSVSTAVTPIPQSGTPEYCGSGNATTITIKAMPLVSGFLAAGSTVTCN